MIGRQRRQVFLLLTVLASLELAVSTTVQAVPSFARQTNLPCNACHTVFPELTPFGRMFKLGGYVMSKSAKAYEFPPPLAGMLQASHTSAKGLTSGVAPFDSANRATDRLALPQQVSIFFGGRIYDKVGAFVQGTYDGASNHSFLDMTDIRYADNTLLWNKTMIYGLTLNNSPTVQDVWNSTPAWGFPFASSTVATTPTAATKLDGALAQQVGGIGAYVFWNNLVYLEGTVYRTTRSGISKLLAAGTPTEEVVDGAAPYWRLALEHRWKNHFFMFGTYGMQADIFPSGEWSGLTDRFTDVAFDAQYQFMGTIEPEHPQIHMQMGGEHKAKTGHHIITAHATWIHEKQDWKASVLLGGAANRSNSLRSLRMNLNYYYRSHVGDIGGSIGYFSTTGTTDQLLYAAAPLDGSRTGSPDSSGYVLEADYRPWEKTKMSLQYVIYNRFNGGHADYDGYGRSAADNRTLYALVVVMW
ncbi:MAG: hypothetical protein B7Z61_05960 [Acidobacteria bacterium 37-71-11]|nr:MAG: hypothetical protein B7Z61_05960 [Acidobacteria bacterium 37-71-11]HQT94046.1 hypothetical protein [Thermoanaerobaculaceae bacterium]